MTRVSNLPELTQYVERQHPTKAIRLQGSVLPNIMPLYQSTWKVACVQRIFVEREQALHTCQSNMQ